MEKTEFPADWNSSVWPKPLTWQSQSEAQRLQEMKLVRVGYVLVPEHFSWGIDIPALGSTEEEPRGLIVSFHVQEAELSISMLLGANMDLEEVLPYVTARFPMQAWKRHAFNQMVQYLTTEEVRQQVPELMALDEQGEGDVDSKAPAKPRKRYKITEGHLKEVVRVYTQAAEEGRPPTMEVADTFEVAHSTAAKWVGAARRAGMLEGVAQKWASKSD